MAATTHHIKLSRFERQPWGFRLHGGADFATPLLIQLVKADSLSEGAGLQAGDLLIAVNGEDVQLCRHKEAQDCIVRAGNNFELTVQRGGVLSQTIKPRESSTPTKGLMGGMGTPQGPAGPGSDKWGNLLEANSAGMAGSAEEFTKQFMSQLTGNTAGNLPPPLLNGTVVPTGKAPEPTEVQYHQQRVSTPTKQSNGTLERGRSPRVAGQYNTPQAMYSEDSLQEVLDQQAGILANGVKGIDFTAERPEGNLAESATLRLVQELDTRGEQHEPGGSRVRSASPAPSYSRDISSPSKGPNSTKSSTPAYAPGNSRDAGNTNSLPRGSETPASPPPAQQQQPSTPSSQRAQPARPTSSQGRGFQWPPPQQEVERSTPFWNSRPNSRTSSPAPARASPAQRDSPASGSRQTQQQQQIPITVPIQSQQQNHATTPIRSQKTQQQQEIPINVPIKTVPSQQQQQQGWSQKLAADSAGAATNAADFTKNFLSQLATSNGSSPATNGSSRSPAAAPPSNGVQPNQLHNPGPENESVGAGRSVSAPRRGRGVLQQQQPGMRVPVCGGCQAPIRNMEREQK